METCGKGGGGGGEAGRRGRSELGRLLETIESSERFEVAAGDLWEEAAQVECVLDTTAFKKGLLLQTNSRCCRGCRLSRISAAGNDVVPLVEALPGGLGASLDAFFDQMGSEVSWEEAEPGSGRAEEEEEELEWLSNKDAFPSVETMALEVGVEEAWALETPPARTKGRQHLTAMETTCRQAQANVPPAKKETTATQVEPVLSQRRCRHCATENTPEWRQGPEGPGTLCNACGMVFRKNGRLLAEYRPANSPGFSPLLHSSTYARALKMHHQNETSATGEMHGKLMDPPPPAKGPTLSVPRRPPRTKEGGGDRRCTRCGTEKTSQWRDGSEGPRTLCDACGVVLKKKGRLLPEYCPANSPAFSPLRRSNRHSRALKRHRQNETTSAACHGELKEGQLLQPQPANGPASSSTLPLRLVLGEEAFAAIRATAEASVAKRAAAFLAAMDN